LKLETENFELTKTLVPDPHNADDRAPAAPSRAAARVVVSLHAAPVAAWLGLLYSVVRAGHVICSDGPWFRRDSHPGYEWIYCVRGQGRFIAGGIEHSIQPGEWVWVNGHHPHAYGPDPADPWEVLWLRFDGPGIEGIWSRLQQCGGPVFPGLAKRSTRTWFSRLFRLLRQDSPPTSAIHAHVASQLAVLLASRDTLSSHEPTLPPGMRRAVDRMRLDSHLPLRVAELARLAGLGESHFTRQFRHLFGTSPIDWLRGERLLRAQRRLVESADSMKEIARQCGWGDPFHFSKDFKRLTGMTPTEYRRRERGE